MRSNKQNSKTCRTAKHCSKSICYLKRLLIVLFNIKTVSILHLLLKWSVVLPTYKSKILSLQSNYGLFYTFFSRKASKFFSNTYALTNLTPRTTTPSALYLPFNRMLLKSHYIILYFSCNSIRYDRRR